MAENAALNLNDEHIRTDGYSERLKDFSVPRDGTSVYFRNLEARLIAHIQLAQEVVGCVAWMTNPRILEALRRKAGVSIVVQKEDFLRPDAGQLHKRSLRELYDSLPSLNRFGFHLLGSMSTHSDPIVEAVRCVGVQSNAVSPKMHHKFVVFCRSGRSSSVAEELYGGVAPVPYAVWTGSFNFTHTGTRSFENAVYIEDPEISRAYLDEWEQIAALSEPLDWESPYVAPQWRIGS
jgi:phosphatidylserine/phosphatidylglycerophosphate/cardiolipin synthase-like enzyme